MHSRSCTAHCPQAVCQCIAGVALPTAPRQCGSALRGFRSLRPRPPAHCPQAVRQCIGGVALPTASRQCGSALQEIHCPLPSAHKSSAAGHTRCSAVHSTKQCGTTQKAMMVVLRGTHGAVGLLTLCDCAQASAGQVQQCTGPAIQQHTSTQRALRHTALPFTCTRGETSRPLPSGNSAFGTTQHNTTQHNTTQHNTTQHNTTQHNTTQHNTTQHNTTQRNTAQHNTAQHNTTQHSITALGVSALYRFHTCSLLPRAHVPFGFVCLSNLPSGQLSNTTSRKRKGFLPLKGSTAGGVDFG